MKRRSSSVRDDGGAEQERGAHLQLAQRHRKIVAGSFKGHSALEPEFATPGVVGKFALRFTTTGPLAKHARITCQLPDHGWTLPTASPPTVVLQLPSPNEQATTAALPLVKMNWSAATRTMEFTLLNESVIPADTPLVLVVSGVGTPEKATPQSEAVVTTFEKLVARSTVPASTRGGQIVDGPAAFAIPKIVPGSIGGAKRWSPSNCCPGVVSDVTLAFTVNGKVPAGGKLLVELPPDGWDMDGQPKVLLRTPVYHNKVLTASWDCNQHTLEIYLGNDGASIATKTNVILTVAQVKNPKKETMILSVSSASSETRAAARLTTLSASGGVIDGPNKVDVARISELRERDFEVLTKVLDADAAENTEDGISIARVPAVLRRAGLTLSDELFQSLVAPCFPVREDPPRGESENNETSLVNTPLAATVTPTTPADDYLSREELLNVFALVYAPAYKYGQELRLACGRGHVNLVREWISRGCNPNAGDASGWSSLHYAADFGQLEVINLLVEMSTPPPENESIGENKSCTLEINARDGHDWTPLMCAAANGHVDVVQRLLALGASVTQTSAEHRSALHWAASRGLAAVVSALLAAGADVHQADRCGWTPLHCATLHGNTSCAALLVEKGADSSARDKLEYTPTFFGDATFLLAPAGP
ncbi:Histone-lysine N-methyltransferase EHMT2 [Phytophthora ramorum]|uniref:Histone-lysine N-methyltransferase EHMT2 n=1 Tax=Phytophthora ramorum TaxID=164328 RepID=UPI0030B11FA4|nr:Histone-lysine N-methyltransferase EHMT2 [Phytophthora ramorum]